MPPCIFIPRVLNYDLDKSPEDNNAQLSVGFYKQVTKLDFPKDLKGAKSFKLNPFFTLTKASELPQRPDDLEDLDP